MMKRSVKIKGHPTSISLESPFWEALQTLAREQSRPVSNLIAEIDENRSGNLSSALRIYVLEKMQKKVR